MPTREASTMTPQEYRAALAALGFSNRYFCRHIAGVDERTGRDWVADKYPVPAIVAAFLRLALAQGLARAQIETLIGKS